MKYKHVKKYISDLRNTPGNEGAEARRFELNGRCVLYTVKEERGEVKHVCKGMSEYTVQRQVVVFGYFEGIEWIPIFRNVRVIDNPGERAEVRSKLLEKLGKESPARRIDGVTFFERV